MGEGEEEITEEQRKRAESNRLAALAKRKTLTEPISSTTTNHRPDPWRLFKCRKLSPQNTSSTTVSSKPVINPGSINTYPIPEPTILPQRFKARLQICSPDLFSVMPLPVPGFAYPVESACLEKLRDYLLNVEPSHYTQNHGGGKACVYKLNDYIAVLRCLKNSKDIECEEIPWSTFNVVERLSHSFAAERWIPCRPEHLSDEKVDELIGKLPKTLLDALMPFQLEGVRFGLRRGGRCLIADEMGLGKTIQAIAIAGCFKSEGSTLVVCPAILRFSWAEELERWFPFCLPSDIHLVFGHQNNPVHLTRLPRVVVISYTMLHRLRKSMLEQEWCTLIVDESHNVRCTKKASEPEEIKAVLDVAAKAKHIVLLSGTPSLSRPYDIFHQINMLWPGLLGNSKYDFAKTYCSAKFIRGCQGKNFWDFSKGIRLEELNVLLKQTVMIRRLKEHVLAQLPPIRRQIIRLVLKRSDIVSARTVGGLVKGDASADEDVRDGPLDVSDECDDNVGHCKSSRKLSYQEIGIAKMSGFLEWLSIHPIITELDDQENMETSPSSHKMIIFGHHHKVLDKVQEFICEKGIGFVRIDGEVLAEDRQSAIQSFQLSKEVKIAIVGILAGGSGLNLTSARNVVFLELPKGPSYMQQAEARAHRLGQTKGVNVYIFCAKDTADESRWQKLNKSLYRISSVMNGKYDAVREIAIESVSYLETTGETDWINGNSIFERAGGEVSAVGVIKLPSSSIDKKFQPVKACNEIDEMDNKRDAMVNEISNMSSQKVNIHPEADIVSKLKTGSHSVLNGGSEGNASEANLGSSGGVSLHNSDDSEDGHQREKVNVFPELTNLNDDGSVELIKDGANNSVQVYSLRFEVSQHTGRIHLYSCIPGTDSRPRPLFENFRAEEVESIHSSAEDSKKMVYKCIKDDPRYRDALMTFINEWKKLRPIEQKKLLSKPLQLPLFIEFCYLKESINHDSGGLLKGGSKRRTTPWDEVSHPLPSNALWRKVRLSGGYGKKEKEYAQGWTLIDEPLCKLCQTPCKGNNAKVPEFFEDLFCNLGCYEEYRQRTSNRSLREGLFQIERGICTICQLNCHKLVDHIRPLSYEKRQEYIKKAAPKLAQRKKLLNKLVIDPTEGNAWHADHIVPVYQGGGECRLENMRTLCVACHADVTVAQCAERRSRRAKAKKQLKVIMSDLRNAHNAAQIDAELQDSCQLENNKKIVEDELVINVPGSAYCRAETISTRSQDQEKAPSNFLDSGNTNSNEAS